jgi:hypothetical protein
MVSGLGRVANVMNLITAVDPAMSARLSAALAHAASWELAVLFLGGLVIGLAGCLLTEWQRRKTLVAVIQHARAGTVITQERGRGGPAMRIEIGAGSMGSNDQSTQGGGG